MSRKFHVLDEVEQKFVHHTDKEAIANAAANANARDTGHDSSVWEGEVSIAEGVVSVTNTGYFVEGGSR